MSFISVIVPALNEEKVLPKFLEDLKKQGKSEILLGIGQSTDNSEIIGKKFGATFCAGRCRFAG